MLSCEVKPPQQAVRIARSHYWDPTSVSESDYEWPRFEQELRYQNFTAIWQRRRTSHRPSDSEGELNRRYVNIPRHLDNIQLPEGDAGAGHISLRGDLSPMSARVQTVDVPSVQSSMLVQVAMYRLNESGFYYGSMSHADARQLLETQSPGTFLVRASSLSTQQLDQHFLFSLTVRTSDLSHGRTTTSVRIELLNTGKFRLDGAEPVSDRLLSSPCVLDLLRQHIASRGVGRQKFVLMDEARHETPLLLQRPLYQSSSPLAMKHLCRRRINASLDGRSVERLPLPPSLKHYLQEYPYDL